MLATLEVGPKSNLVVYEMVPTRRRKAIPVHLSMQQQDEAVSLAFSADGKLLAALMPEPPPAPSSTNPSAPASASSSHHQATSSHLSYSITVYLWRTGKTLASISLGTSSLPAISPQVRNDLILPRRL